MLDFTTYSFSYIQYLTKVSTPLTFQQPFYYVLNGQYYRNENCIYFRAENVQLV